MCLKKTYIRIILKTLVGLLVIGVSNSCIKSNLNFDSMVFDFLFKNINHIKRTVFNFPTKLDQAVRN